MKCFLICPVRNITDNERSQLEFLVSEIEANSVQVYYPARDTNQDDPTGGIRICYDNKKAIEEADVVLAAWNGTSIGSIFDLGVAFGLDKPVIMVDIFNVDLTAGKNFTNVVKSLDQEAMEKLGWDTINTIFG